MLSPVPGLNLSLNNTVHDVLIAIKLSKLMLRPPTFRSSRSDSYVTPAEPVSAENPIFLLPLSDSVFVRVKDTESLMMNVSRF